MKYEVAHGSFSGPLEALLELVERNKLDITDISLTTVTGDFLRYVNELVRAPEPRSISVVHAIADFLSVATRLLVLKSRTLLPHEHEIDAEEEDPALLAEQLRTYQTIKPALVAFRKAYAKRQPLAARPYLKGMRTTQVYAPPAGLQITELHAALGRVLQLASAVAKEVGEIRHKVISLQKAISDLVHRITTSGTTRFSELVHDRTPGDRIVLFLAALHLARDQKVSLVQEEAFSDIVIEHGQAA